MPQKSESIRILGVRVDDVDWSAIESFCRVALKQETPQHIITVNGEHILAAQDDKAYKTIINEADLIIPDSTNVVWVSHLKGRGLTMRTPGADLVTHLCRIATETGTSVYLLGGMGDVAKKAAEKLREIFPDLKIAGTSAKDPEDSSSAQDIKAAAADIVLVAYGAPKHEFWISSNKSATGAKILVGIGGALDMLAGYLPRAPKIFRALSLEWLWRLALQPSRFKRMWRAVVVFPLKALFTSST